MTTRRWEWEAATGPAASAAPDVWRTIQSALEAEATAGPAREPGGGLWQEVAARSDVLQTRPQQAAGVVSRQLQGRQGPYHVLKNATEHTYLLLSPKEFWIWERLDGAHSIQDLVVAYFAEHGTFAFGLVLGLMQSLSSHRMLAEKPQALFTSIGEALAQRTLAHKLTWPARVLLTRTWTIRGLDGALQRLYRAAAWLLYTWPLQVLFWLVSLAGLVIFVRLLRDPHFEFAGGNLGVGAVVLWLAAIGPVIIHELGHALTVRHYGREVNSGGLMLYFGMPAAFVDTSDIYMEGRGPRLAVTWAGPFSGLILGGICALAAWAWPEAGAAQLLFKVASISILLSLLNLNPLLKLDGYWLLSDALDIAGLRERSLAFLRHKFLGKLRGRERYSREEIIFLVFGILAVLWSVYAIYLALAVWNGRLAAAVADLFSGRADLLSAITDALLVLLGLSFLSLVGVQAYRWGRSVLASLRHSKVLAETRRAALAATLGAVLLALLPWVLPPALATAAYLGLNLLAYGGSVFLAWRVARAMAGSRFRPAWVLAALGGAALGATGVLWALSPALRTFGVAGAPDWAGGADLIGLILVGGACMWARNLFAGLRGRWRGLSVLLLGLGWVAALAGFLVPASPWRMGGHLLAGWLTLGGLLHWQAWPLPRTTLSPPPPTDRREVPSLRERLTTHENLLAAVEILTNAVFGQLASAYGRAADRVRERFERWLERRGLGISVTARPAAATGAGGPGDSHVLIRVDQLLDADLPIADFAEVLDVALDGLLDEVAREAGHAFAHQAFAQGYDSLDWAVREVLEEFVLSKMAWAAGLAERLGRDRSAAIVLLERLSLMDSLTPRELRQVAGRVQPLSYAQGETIIRQGEAGDRFYIVRSGRVAVLRRDEQGAEHRLNELVSGDYFGEAALLTRAPRNATIRAMTPVEVLALDRHDFDRLALESFQGREKVYGSLRLLGLLRNMPVFADFEDTELQAVAAKLARLAVAPGEPVYCQGAPGDRFYIVEVGGVDIRRVRGDGEMEELARLGPGEYFGEIALLMNVPRTATVVAAEPTTLLALAAEDFGALVRQSQAVRSALERTGSRRIWLNEKVRER